MELLNVLGTKNPADLFTKYVEAPNLGHALEKMGLRQESGRAASAPAAATAK